MKAQIERITSLWVRLKERWKKDESRNLATVIGVMVAIFGLVLSNCHTSRQISIANKQLELASRPYLYILKAGWWETKSVSGDIGTRAGFTIKNAGRGPARTVRIKKDFVIRVSAPKYKEHLEQMRQPSDALNMEQEKFWNEYLLYREQPVKELASFFRNGRWRGTKEKDIERFFDEKWSRKGGDYSCEVYGPVEPQYRMEPWVLATESHDISIGRSTSRPTKSFTDPGGDLLFVYIIFEYRGFVKKKHDYELHYIGYFNNSKSKELSGVVVPLATYATWDEPD